MGPAADIIDLCQLKEPRLGQVKVCGVSRVPRSPIRATMVNHGDQSAHTTGHGMLLDEHMGQEVNFDPTAVTRLREEKSDSERTSCIKTICPSLLH